MKILARCYDRVLVEAGRRRVGIAHLRVEPRGRELAEGVELERVVDVSFDPDKLVIHQCDGCDNYGPRAVPAGDHGAFQQFALSPSAPPWKGGKEGYYCMGCSFPPR